MLNFCGIVAAFLKMATGRNFSMSGINSGHHIKFWWYRAMLNFCVIVVAILKMAAGRNFYPPFLYRVLAAILKMADILKILKTQNCSSNGDLSLCQILFLYHYPVRSYHH
jgi:hypothetical protein